MNIPPGCITTGYLAYDCRVMSRVAAALGRHEDVAWYQQTETEVETAINTRWFDAKTGFYRPGSQGANLFPLLLGFSPDPARTAEHLLADLQAHGGHMTTGNQMTKHWFAVLDALGRSDIALSLALSDTYPSLGFMLENGATTLWERWERLDGCGMNSHNHPMNGAYTVWYYQTLAGIRRGEDGTLILRPAFWLDIASVEAETGSAQGRIRSGFFRTVDGIRLTFTVPWNTTAQIIIPLDGVNTVWEGETVLFQPGDPFKEELVLRRAAGTWEFTVATDRK